ncbi:MAG: response regulator transcription factor [Chloroflexi bacterium]|jgi:DNA-binding response OmpR family regulator|nr:DNA-binding response regulator [Chloroflexota bacterium]MBV6434886.1 Alkaline phosphatase synthesis transcriptional regulatory protein PhoP [Anaerolineae bacterium]MDL1916306.1 response regulator transcription factor [Anaerolineae bacterium CFX4]OQY81422.1 MAG: DNA-binding response regulator [Anaerolineae bacterium UTCFX5]MBW7878569.1 response regulator transcription factor [Anaerolineae bacterium]
MTETILIIDDEQRIIDLARMYLEQDGYLVKHETDGQAGYRHIVEHEPSLIVLDLMLPGMDGLEICRRVRAQSDVPIIMLTARSDDIDKIVGLELGADDYLTKPFNPRELLARVKAILRRTDRKTAPTSEVVAVGNLTIDPDRRVIAVDGREVQLRMKEFDLIFVLARNPGRVFSRERLLEVVWGYDFAGETRTVDVHIAHLRHKLDGMRPTIETVWGVGYKLESR